MLRAKFGEKRPVTGPAKALIASFYLDNILFSSILNFLKGVTKNV
jgi:hypothetical protein